MQAVAVAALPGTGAISGAGSSVDGSGDVRGFVHQVFRVPGGRERDGSSTVVLFGDSVAVSFATTRSVQEVVSSQGLFGVLG